MTTVKAWAVDVAIRAVKTAAQTLAGMLGANAVDVLHVDWRADLAVAAGAAVACILQNVQSFPSPNASTPEPVGSYARGVNGTASTFPAPPDAG